MSNKSKRAHLRKPGGTRAVCRYASRPSRNVEGLGLIAFKEVAVALRCVECNLFYEALKGRATGSGNV